MEGDGPDTGDGGDRKGSKVDQDLRKEKGLKSSRYAAHTRIKASSSDMVAPIHPIEPLRIAIVSAWVHPRHGALQQSCGGRCTTA